VIGLRRKGEKKSIPHKNPREREREREGGRESSLFKLFERV